MGSAPSPPPVPSMNSVVSSQQNQNTGAQAASNYNLNNPYGNETFAQTGTDPTTGMPIYTINQNYSPDQQKILQQQQTGQQGAGGAVTSLGSMLPSLFGSPADLAGDSSSLTNQLESPVISNLWNTAMQYQEPQLRTQLLNQGIPEDSPAFKQAMDNLTNQQIQSFGQVNSQFQPQAFAEAVQQKQLPLSNFQTLLGDVQPSQAPNSAGMGASAQPANVIGADAATNQANMAAYQAQMQKYSAMMSGIASIGSAGITGGLNMYGLMNQGGAGGYG